MDLYINVKLLVHALYSVPGGDHTTLFKRSLNTVYDVSVPYTIKYRRK